MSNIRYRDSLIIHLFALAHALIAILTRLVHYVDDVPLTILTISMIVIISIRKRIYPEVMAALTLIGCFAGYLIGTWGGELVLAVVHNEMLSAAITTAAVTELIGWSVHGFACIKRAPSEHDSRWIPSLIQVLLFSAGILFLRIGYMLIFQSPAFAPEGTGNEFKLLFGNTLSMMTLVCANVIFVSFLPRVIKQTRWKNFTSLASTILLSLLVSVFTYFNIPSSPSHDFELLGFVRTFSVVLLVDLILFTLFTLIHYAIESKERINRERDKKHLAQFQYNKLKLQINPHFLFNSLNILDYLVQEGETERASSFIHKLAGIYRYMLKNEDKPLVLLEEEIEFGRQYIDLLQERFTTGFQVEFDIPDEDLSKSVVPCCLQLLIENATKHNVVSTESPLLIRICAEDGWLSVRNNLQPRMNATPSTGIGLKNIRQQYLDLAGKEIQIQKTDGEFSVKLPLIYTEKS